MASPNSCLLSLAYISWRVVLADIIVSSFKIFDPINRQSVINSFLIFSLSFRNGTHSVLMLYDKALLGKGRICSCMTSSRLVLLDLILVQVWIGQEFRFKFLSFSW